MSRPKHLNGARPTRFCSRSNTTISMAMSRPATTRAAVSCAARATAIAERDAFGSRACAKASAAVLAATMRSRSAAEPPAASASSASVARSTAPRLECRSVQALRELGHLGDAAGDGDARHRMAAQIFQHAADEVAHVDQRDLRQTVELLHRRLGACAGRAGDMGEAGGARDVDAANGSSGSTPSTNRARRCRWCRGSTSRRRCRAGR